MFGVKESIQGKWYPNMWGNVGKAEMERLHVIEEPEIKMKKKRIPDQRPGKIVSDLLNNIRSEKESIDRQTIE